MPNIQYKHYKRNSSSVGHSELRFSFQIVMELKRIKEKENEFVSEKNGKGLSEQMRYLSSHGGMFLSRKNDFPFYTTCTAGCCTQLHCICLSFKHISASHLFSSLYLPTHPPAPSSLLHASCTVSCRVLGEREAAKKPDNQEAVTSGPH